MDKDGQAEMVQLDSVHRLKTIYRTNLHTARAAGQTEAEAGTNVDYATTHQLGAKQGQFSRGNDKT